ncbi:MAG: PKD domain-containing protein, partial [Lacibacter sp.]
MKKFLTLALTLIVLKIATGQTFTMGPGANGTKTTCTGTFVDGGGTANNYSSDQNSTITFCPSTPGQIIKVTFTSFNTQNATTGCWDYLDVWYGSTVGAAGTEDDRFCGNRPSFSITSLSPDGCISFRFTSDGSVTRAGWVATISCVTPCTNPIAAIVNNSTANLCSTAPTVTVDGSPSTAPGPISGISRYEWNWGDGTTSNSTTAVTSHTYTNPGVYLVRLAVRNNNFGVDPLGCRSTNAVTKIVKVMPTPDFTGTTTGPANISCGQSVTFNGSATSQTKVQVTPSIKSGIVNLPDGTGVSYTSQLDFTGLFPPGATVSAGCYPTVKFDLEHSFSADLDIELIAPTGQTVKLFDNHNNQGGVSGISVFGSCVNNQDDGVAGCTASYTVVNTGAVAWTAAGVTNTTPSPCASYSGPCYTTTLTNRPVVYFKPQTFNSTQPFTVLNGADLNGVWTLKITDTRALDDGVLNDWSLTFPSSCYGTLETVTPAISSLTWKLSGSGPAVPAHTSNSVSVTNPGPDACPTTATCVGNKQTNTVTVGPFNTAGSYVYTLEAQDEFGCKYTRDVTVNVACPTCNLNLTSVPATINQSLCVNTAITPITYSVGGSATGATVSGLPSTLTGTFNAGVLTITG